jgi:hypothetical protein
MLENFVTWETLAVFGSLVTVSFVIVEFIKDLPLVKKIKTKYLSWFVALGLMVITNIVLGTFVAVDLVLYAISAILISMSANGLSDFNNPVDKSRKDIKIVYPTLEELNQEYDYNAYVEDGQEFTEIDK